MKPRLIFWLLLLTSLTATAQIKHGLRDDAGRHVIPRGFVVNTNQGQRQISFNSDDYLRMVRLGANAQTIRLELGRISTFPGGSVEPAYLAKLDSLVDLGRHAGMQTVFKLTVYGVEEFEWETFWLNEKDEYATYIEAWKIIWNRYADEPSVLGYDIVNEPRKLTMDISYDELTRQYLIPLYQRIIDESQRINPDKKILFQSIFMNKGEGIDNNQYAEITAPINRKNILFAPHIYQNDIDFIAPVMDRFDEESDLLEAPIFIGEWGFPTFASTDTTVEGRLGQLSYRELYVRTAEVFDRMGIGAIKAWFLGSRNMQNFLAGGPSTWAIFTDESDAGTAERKYITDVIARPFPQAIAGDIQSFMFNHATRTLDLKLISDNAKGGSTLFIGANRHYPDGFSVLIGDDLVLYHDPIGSGGLEVHRSPATVSAADYVWDERRQKLLIARWPADGALVHVRIVPGVRNFDVPVRKGGR
ncbi:cellulase family glycosylhydrolase [Neolewinella antarctica]|uniref:Glycoside hydrolase family 5 domain-containing protein n=1 Tax=Neolewinella antarctica TaxID=442734 RepID=A0ABX0X9R7_9BACT|nr:cellulase family glycosylhydrolase [Neolewinella antarctica]NJC25699.1 hypothetical protein [Neolewinella antarctica]